MSRADSQGAETQGPQLVFLSYSRRDAGIVTKLSMFIRAVGASPWRDEDGIAPGTRWRVSITSTIQNCDRMLVFWCRHSRGSQEVRKEYQQAIDLNKILVPVRLDRSIIPRPLSEFHAIDIRKLTWWSHEIARWERYPWFLGLILIAIGAVYGLL